VPLPSVDELTPFPTLEGATADDELAAALVVGAKPKKPEAPEPAESVVLVDDNPKLNPVDFDGLEENMEVTDAAVDGNNVEEAVDVSDDEACEKLKEMLDADLSGPAKPVNPEKLFKLLVDGELSLLSPRRRAILICLDLKTSGLAAENTLGSSATSSSSV